MAPGICLSAQCSTIKRDAAFRTSLTADRLQVRNRIRGKGAFDTLSLDGWSLLLELLKCMMNAKTPRRKARKEKAENGRIPLCFYV